MARPCGGVLPTLLSWHDGSPSRRKSRVALLARADALRTLDCSAPDILGLRNEKIPGAVARPMFAWPQRFMLLRVACAPGAMLTERAAAPLLSSYGD